MVQLNPAKWGRETRQKNRRILEIKESLKRNTRGQGGAGQRRRNLKRELASLGGKTDAQIEREKRVAARKDKRSRKKYDQENKIINKRGRVTGYKEGYDPSKGIKGSGTSSKSKKKGTVISNTAERKKAMQKKAGDLNTDFQSYKKGTMSLSDFIKKNPTSNTAKEANRKGSTLNRKLSREAKNVKPTKKRGRVR